jgi:hypothetical protein
MRVAMYIVAVLVMTTPSEASKSCMTKAEARQHFSSVHIYWHGPDHCWDANPTRRHGLQKVGQKTPTRPKTPVREVERTTDQAKWRDSRSEVLVDNEPGQPLGVTADARRDGDDDAVPSTPWIDRWMDAEPSPLAARWVDIAPVKRPPIIERKTEQSVRSYRVVLVFVVFVVLALGTIEVVSRRPNYAWPPSGRMT